MGHHRFIEGPFSNLVWRDKIKGNLTVFSIRNFLAVLLLVILFSACSETPQGYVPVVGPDKIGASMMDWLYYNRVLAGETSL